jgi:hypothetical protein
MNPLNATFRRIQDQWSLLLVVVLVLIFAHFGYLPYLPLSASPAPLGGGVEGVGGARPGHSGLAVEWLVVGQSAQGQDIFPWVPEVRHSVVQAVGSGTDFHRQPQIAAVGSAASSLWVAWNQTRLPAVDPRAELAQVQVAAAWSPNGSDWTSIGGLFEWEAGTSELTLGAETMAIHPFVTAGERVFAVARLHEVVGFGTSTATTFGEPDVDAWTEAYPKPILRIVGYLLREVLADGQLGPQVRLGSDAGTNRQTLVTALMAAGPDDAVIGHLTRSLYHPGGPPGSPLKFPPAETTTIDRYRLAYPTSISFSDNRHFRLWSSEQRLDRLYMQFSPDGGVTWTAAKPTNIPNTGLTAVLGKLPAGPVYLVGNQAPDNPSGTHSLSVALAYENLQFTQCFYVRTVPPPPSRGQGGGVFTRPGELGFQASAGCIWGDGLWLAYSVNSAAIHVSRIPLEVLSPAMVDETEGALPRD